MRRLMTIALASFALSAFAAQDKVEIEPVKDGFVRVVTPGYSFEMPKAWTVGKETPWGARDIKTTAADSKMGTMTADASTATWDSLYKTSLRFILREEAGSPTEYAKLKSAKGYEGISFEVANKDGFVARRYVLLKNSDGRALALSVRIGSKENEKEMVKAFRRMVATATFR